MRATRKNESTCHGTARSSVVACWQGSFASIVRGFLPEALPRAVQTRPWPGRQRSLKEKPRSRRFQGEGEKPGVALQEGANGAAATVADGLNGMQERVRPVRPTMGTGDWRDPVGFWLKRAGGGGVVVLSMRMRMP